MYIKFSNNIHNISKYKSIVKGGTLKSIHLINGDNFMALDFTNSKVRDYILSEIWIKLKEEEKFYDIDAAIELYQATNKYNL